MDLLTRGAGFGYIGSTITSLIYAGFTFIFFAIEAAIMSLALEMYFGIPLSIGYLLSSLAIIPLVTQWRCSNTTPTPLPAHRTRPIP